MTTSTSTSGEKPREARASRRRRQSYRSLYEDTPVMMHSIDRDGRLMAVNNRWLEVLDSGENPGLTQRQLEVLQSLALGKRYKEIAEELSVSLNTIKTHTENLYERLGANNRTQAITSARERGILNE